MIWYICLIAASVILAVTIALYIRKRFIKKKKMSVSMRTLFIGFFCALTVLMYPVQLDAAGSGEGSVFRAILMSANRALRAFALTDVSFVSDSNSIDSSLLGVYSCALAALCFISPFLSIGYILSFFNKARASFKFAFSFRRDLYVFSQLNERSIVLAQDITDTAKRARIVFCDVSDACRAERSGLIHSAELLDSVCFNRDILSVDFGRHPKGRDIVFFAINDDEQKNTADAIDLMSKYKDRDNTALYLFSELPESRMVLSGADSGSIKLRRIENTQNIVYRFLFDNGIELFSEDLPTDPATGKKLISVMIAGLGDFGKKMLKALLWYCQMDGYILEIDAFDRDPSTEDALRADCPELFDNAHNGKCDPGEASYTVRFHCGDDINSQKNADIIGSMKHTSFVFVSLGGDNPSLEASLRIRTLTERAGLHPAIYTVISSSEKKSMIEGAVNFKGQSYDIKVIGDIKTAYSKNEIMMSDVEAAALSLHNKDYPEESFHRFEYNHHSSCARAIHRKARKELERLGLRDKDACDAPMLEHVRWNAYTRGEGYVYSGSTDRESRSDMAKTHNCLVNYSQLSDSYKEKDRENGPE